jgi:4-methylaminobutanoate oxidase (formaldehyde-forming)
MACESLVLAPGVWARAAGRLIGLDLPVASISHQYAVTEASPLITRDLPAFRDPDLNFYLKPDAGAFAIGGWEADSRPAHDGETPADFVRALLADDLERLSPILQNAMQRLPLVGELGIRRVINGPIPVTPDGEPMVGPAPGWRNVFMGIGFTSGIAASAGAGKALAEWILAGAPEFPLPSLDPARFGTEPFPLDALNRRACAAYSAYYALAEPRGGIDAGAKDGIFAMPASSAIRPSFTQASRKPRQEP